MRNDKDNTRRIGGLMLDLLLLSFIVSFSLSDVKITDGNTDDTVTISAAPEDHIIVSNFDSLFGSFLKQLSKVQPPASQFIGVIFDFPRSEEVKRIVLADTLCLYKTVFANATINAP